MFSYVCTISFDKTGGPDDNSSFKLPERIFLSFVRNRLSRRLLTICGAAAVCLMLQTAGRAQAAPAGTTQPIDAPGVFLQSQGAQPRFEAASKLSNEARVAVKQDRILSVPHFSGSFAWQG